MLSARVSRGRDRNTTGTREGCNPRCENMGIRNPLEFACDANLNPEDALLLSDGGLVMFANLILVGYSARRACELSREAISPPRVLYSLRLLALCRVSSRTLYTCCWLDPHRYRALAHLQDSRTRTVLEVSGSLLTLLEKEDG